MTREEPGKRESPRGFFDEESYRRVVEKLLDALVVVDLEERIRYANGAFCRLVHYSAEELLGLPFSRFVCARDAALLRARTARRVAGAAGESYEIELLPRSGPPRVVTVSGSALLGPGGSVVGTVGVMKDVTEKCRLEAQLRESRDRLARFHRATAALSASPALFTGGLHEAGDALTQSALEALALHSASLWTLDETRRELELLSRRERGGRALERGLRVALAGSYGEELVRQRVLVFPRAAHAASVPLCAPALHSLGELPRLDAAVQSEGSLVGVLSVEGERPGLVFGGEEGIFLAGLADSAARAWETRRRRRAEEETRSVARFSAENPSPVLRARLDGELLYANPASTPLLAQWHEGGEVHLPTWLREVSRRAFEEASVESVRCAAEGRVYSLNVVPVHEGDYVNFYATDVTELERSVDELIATREKALAAAQAKSQFLANMSHEIRTPMNAVLGMAELLLDSELEPEQRHFAETIAASGRSLLAVINDVLDFSKIEAGRLVLDNQPFSPIELVEDVATTLALQACEKGLDLATEIDPPLMAPALGDPGRLRQVLLNLLANALKFTERGEVVLRVALERAPRAPLAPGARAGSASAGEERLVFEVRDTGIGIEASKQASIFDAFAQADASMTRRFGGTGLGLAIGARLARAMGGALEVQSAPGRGSRFLLSLPYQPYAETTARSEGSDACPLRGRRILVIEPRPASRRALCRMLGALGAEAEGVASTDALPAELSHDILLVDDELRGSPALEPLSRQARVVHLGAATLGERGGHRDSPPSTIGRPVRVAHLLAALAQENDAPLCVKTDGPSDEEQPRALRVLVAEDHAVNRLLVRRLLERRGHQVVSVPNGEKALAALAAGPFDAVLMDVQMPVLDGLSACRAWRRREEDEGRARLPIIALTAHASTEARDECLAAGMDAHLTKPIEAERLEEALAFHTSDQESSEGPAPSQAEIAPISTS